jgi:PPP family 3-phenylpropionic acid transporter
MPNVARHLATFYLGYFGLLGVLLPYLSLYLLDIGLDPYQIGVVMAMTPLVKTVAPSIWGWAADRRGSRLALMRLACAGALATFGLLLAVRQFLWIAAVMALYAVFTSSILPLVEATAMEAVDRHRVDYGRIRLWGSVGFIVLSLGMGPVLDVAPSVLVIYTILAMLAFNLWSVTHLPDGQPTHRPTGGGVKALLTRRPVLAFYGVCLLMQASHGAYYGFYSVYLEGLGFSRTAIGLLWAVGVGAEVTAMLFSGRLLARLGTRRLMLLALGLTVIRWGMLATGASLAWLLPAQLLHAASFGLFHVSAVTHTHRIIPAPFRATGQSLYSSLSFGLGLTVAMYLSGYFYDAVGAPVLFAAAAVVAALAGILALTLEHAPAAQAEEAAHS